MTGARPAPGWPLYTHPATDPAAWTRAVDLAGTWEGWGDGLLVVNVSSGPGSPTEANAYRPVLDRLQRSAPPVCVAGYVPIAWGERSPAAVRRDARAWRRRHGLRALMLDEFCCGAEPAGQLDTCVALLEELRPDWDRVVVNPGCAMTPELAGRLPGLVDAACTAEGAHQDVAASTTSPLPRGALRWELVHSAPPGAGCRCGSGADLAWCTSATLPHPWDGSGSADGA